MTDIRVPKFAGDAPYLLIDWLVHDGRPVRPGEAVATFETARAIEIVRAGAEGVLHQLVEDGTQCRPGQLIGRLNDHPSGNGDGDGTRVNHAVADGPAARRRRLKPFPVGNGSTAGTRTDGHDGHSLDGHAVLDGHALDGHTVDGQAVDGHAQDGAGLYRLTAAQRALHATVTASQQTIPAAFAAVNVDVGAARHVGRELSTRLQAPVGLPELLIAAAAAQHRDFPLFFASLVDERTARLAARPDIGVTVDVGKGLFIPVIRDAASRGIKEIAQAIMRFRLTALRGSFSEADLAGANLTVALHTDDDVVMAVPLVYPGQSCTLSLSATRREMVPGAEGAIIARTVATLGISYDHRLITGRSAAVFINEIRETLESPARLTG